MYKTILIALGLALTSTAQAQNIYDQVQLSGQRSGANPQAAARAGEVSQLQEVLAQSYTGGVWVDLSRNLYLRYHSTTLPGLIHTDRKSGTA